MSTSRSMLAHLAQLCSYVSPETNAESLQASMKVWHVLLATELRKTFKLKYNPDLHWSNALYQGLNKVQYTDGWQILNINCDEAAGFCLDTMATYHLHKTPAVQGHETLTTYTDYVNRYPSILQTTSYNFTDTQTTGEVCAGIVKASLVYPKNPCQQACCWSCFPRATR